MPNPGTLTSLQAFDRETLNTVIHIPDYSLRRQLAFVHKEALVVEAFTAFDELFHLHLRWLNGRSYPDLQLTSVTWHCQKVVLDIVIQSPHFTHTAGFGLWSSSTLPVEVNRSGLAVPLKVNQPPVTANDSHIGLEQTVTFTLTGTMWKLDESDLSALQCKSFRERARDVAPGRRLNATPRMVDSHASMLSATDGKQDVRIELDETEDRCYTPVIPPTTLSPPRTPRSPEPVGPSTGRIIELDAPLDSGRRSEAEVPESAVKSAPAQTRFVHAFVLQAQSPVFRRMLAGDMREATEGVIKMAGVTPVELDDFLRALYSLAVPPDVYEDTERLLSLLAIADRYGVVALRDDCAATLEGRLTEANMASLLKVADMHEASNLRAAALQFIARRADWMVAVMDTDDASVRRSVREHFQSIELAKKKARDSEEAATDGVEITV